ncbi:MAG: hypothetical protein WHT08_18215 [Bryobacteraceae bacterium]
MVAEIAETVEGYGSAYYSDGRAERAGDIEHPSALERLGEERTAMWRGRTQVCGSFPEAAAGGWAGWHGHASDRPKKVRGIPLEPAAPFDDPPGPDAGADGFQRWLVDRAIRLYYQERDYAPPTTPEPEPSHLRAVCGRTPVEIRRDGTRWLLYAGAPLERVRPFATPFLGHARREAEARYGAATSGWRSV